jgi:hypothetical protein
MTHLHDLFATTPADDPPVVKRQGHGLGGLREARRLADLIKYAYAMEETRERRAKITEPAARSNKRAGAA